MSPSTAPEAGHKAPENNGNRPYFYRHPPFAEHAQNAQAKLMQGDFKEGSFYESMAFAYIKYALGEYQQGTAWAQSAIAGPLSEQQERSALLAVFASNQGQRFEATHHLRRLLSRSDHEMSNRCEALFHLAMANLETPENQRQHLEHASKLSISPAIGHRIHLQLAQGELNLKKAQFHLRQAMQLASQKAAWRAYLTCGLISVCRLYEHGLFSQAAAESGNLSAQAYARELPQDGQHLKLWEALCHSELWSGERLSQRLWNELFKGQVHNSTSLCTRVLMLADTLSNADEPGEALSVLLTCSAHWQLSGQHRQSNLCLERARQIAKASIRSPQELQYQVRDTLYAGLI